MKYKILLIFSVLTFGLFLPKANNSAIAQSNEDFSTTVYKTREEISDLTQGIKNLLSDRKKLLLEMDLLIKDIDKIIGKIDKNEITNYNNEIKNINDMIGNLDNKNDDIIDRQNELNSREDSVSKTPGVGYMVDWTDKNKVVDEWNALRDEEDIPKWNIYNKKVETFNNITANLSNHPKSCATSFRNERPSMIGNV